MNLFKNQLYALMRLPSSTWFVHLKTLHDHPLLLEEEKILWLWLATQSASNPTFSCSLSYEQIAQAINTTEKIVHRCLFRLKIMGLLKSDIPIWYGTPTSEMAKMIRLLKLKLPEKLPSPFCKGTQRTQNVRCEVSEVFRTSSSWLDSQLE